MELLKQVIQSIRPIERSIQTEIQLHLDSLTKPQGSLGRLEAIAMQYCVITGYAKPLLVKKKIFIFAADHGVVEEGVSAFPKAVTLQMVKNMLAGRAAINVLARHVGTEVSVIDIGVDANSKDIPGLINRKIRKGTDNITQGPAMTEHDAVKALQVGIELAKRAVTDESVSLIGTGDMGIGNTTPSSALYAALLPCEVEEITGRGTGISDDGLARKITSIKKALEINRNRISNPLSALAALGGFEIAGICGLILGAASLRVPIVVDGFISSAAALVACKICESVKDYLFFSHCSNEKGHKMFFNVFGVEPLLDLKMRLGEGTGAALAMSIIEASIKIYNEMATFSSAGVNEKSGMRRNA